MSVSRQPRDSAAEASDLAPKYPEKGPRARTRRLMLKTAIQLMQRGFTPSVSDVAEAAEVSRATAYRYFPSQSALVKAVVGEGLGPILKWSSDLDDGEARIADLFETSFPRICRYEATFRAALKLSLDHWAKQQAGTLGNEPPFKRGYRIALLREAAEPLRSELPPDEFERLIKALALLFGVEALVILGDFFEISSEDAQEVPVWAARALIRDSLLNARASA